MTSDRERGGRTRKAAIWGTYAIALLVVSSCGPRPIPTPAPYDPVAAPAPEEVESVLFLFGDAGDAVLDRSPTLERMRRDVEEWASRLSADSAVAVIALGDIVYPEGVREPGTAEYERDVSVVMSQVALVTSRAAMEHDTPLWVLAGNHDWGLRRHRAGFVRLKNLDAVLETARTSAGIPVRIVPEAGTGGPYVVDWGDHARLIFLDTAWWLVAATSAERAAVLQGVDRALATAGEREIFLLAHHPFKSGGPHGGGFDIWETFGFRYILHRTGVILQDVTSLPYRDLEAGLRAAFARHGRPLVFIGGHEHSLQVLSGPESTDPRYGIVSGSASKHSEVGPDPALLFGQSAPGYVRLLIENDGGVAAFVEATRPEYLLCPEDDPDRSTCMAEGIAAFQTVYSIRLK